MTTDGDNMGDLQRSGGPILHWKQASEKVYWPPVIPLSCQQPRPSDEAPQIPSRCLRRDLILSARFTAVSEDEFAMLGLASRAVIAVQDNRLVEMSEIKGLPEEPRAPASKALAGQRFDRAAGRAPDHTEDFAQVFGQYPNDKYHFRSYANVPSVLWAEAGEGADRSKPVLPPGYDFVATLP